MKKERGLRDSKVSPERHGSRERKTVEDSEITGRQKGKRVSFQEKWTKENLNTETGESCVHLREQKNLSRLVKEFLAKDASRMSEATGHEPARLSRKVVRGAN